MDTKGAPHYTATKDSDIEMLVTFRRRGKPNHAIDQYFMGSIHLRKV